MPWWELPAAAGPCGSQTREADASLWRTGPSPRAPDHRATEHGPPSSLARCLRALGSSDIATLGGACLATCGSLTREGWRFTPVCPFLSQTRLSATAPWRPSLTVPAVPDASLN